MKRKLISLFIIGIMIISNVVYAKSNYSFKEIYGMDEAQFIGYFKDVYNRFNIGLSLDDTYSVDWNGNKTEINYEEELSKKNIY